MKLWLCHSQCRIADVVETEYELFLKSDPDPFDDRHPGIVRCETYSRIFAV